MSYFITLANDPTECKYVSVGKDFYSKSTDVIYSNITMVLFC